MSLGEKTLSGLEAMVTPEQPVVRPDEGITPTPIEVSTTQPTYPTIGEGEDLKTFLGFNPEVGTLELGITGNPEESFQAFNLGSDFLDCTSMGTCSTFEPGLSST